jgi:hypothetical protein
MKHDKILPKKYVDPKKGLSYYLIPQAHKMFKKKVNLYLLQYEPIVAIHYNIWMHTFK